MGETPLHFDPRNEKSSEIARCLIEGGCDVDAVDGSGETALTRAVCAKRIAVLIKAGADTTLGTYVCQVRTALLLALQLSCSAPLARAAAR